MLIRAVIFDLGGVLVRTEDQAPRRELAERLGITRQEMYYLVFDSPSARQASLGEISAEQHMENVRLTLGVPAEDFSTVPGAFWSGDRLDMGLVDYLRSLRPGYKTALLSNAWNDLRGMLSERWKITDAFDELVISAEVGITKPDPRIYQLALQRLQVAPHEAVFVDDFIENINGGKAVGLHTVHFRNPEQAIADLSNLLNNQV
jgi:epoxide hydrolase-like predicted phosphatase